MDLVYARHIAEGIVFQLAPLCEKIIIAGSIRRHKPEVHDIDVVCQPRRDVEKDMFGTVTGHRVIPEFITAVNQWTKVKGEATGKYTQRLLKDGTKLEIAIADPDNWGNLVLIRTGNADFSKMIMTRALHLGFQQRDGFLWDEDRMIPIKEEEDYFKILNLPYIEPSKRDINAFR